MTMTRNSRTSCSLLLLVREGHRFESRFQNRLLDSRFSMVSSIILGDCLGHCFAVANFVSFHIGISLLSHSKKQSNISCDVKRNDYNMYHFLNVKNSALFSSYVYVSIIWSSEEAVLISLCDFKRLGGLMEDSVLSVKRNSIYTFYLNEFQVRKG